MLVGANLDIHSVTDITGKSVAAVQKVLVGYAGSAVKLMLRRDMGEDGERLLHVELVRGTPVFWQFQTGDLLSRYADFKFVCACICVFEYIDMHVFCIFRIHLYACMRMSHI
jgi:hypothetical protein